MGARQGHRQEYLKRQKFAMSHICPHCNYVRKASDSVPDWQCPACEKAYSKASNPLPPDSLRIYGPAVASERSGGIGKYLLVLLMLGAAFWFGRPLMQARDVHVAAVSANQPEVILYATDWCGYCKLTREFFHANGIRYTEQDIEKSSAALAERQKLGGNGIPVIVVGDKVIKGYSEGELRQILRPWLKG
jgi:glutaredoxin